MVSLSLIQGGIGEERMARLACRKVDTVDATKDGEKEEKKGSMTGGGGKLLGRESQSQSLGGKSQEDEWYQLAETKFN